MVSRHAYSSRHLPINLYRYLIGTYSKFLATGKCLDFPLVLQIQTQSFCNGRCLICPYPIVSKKLDQGTMDWDLFTKIAHELASEPPTKVIFELHNEPLLDKRILDCVKYLKSISPDNYCSIVSNGELLDRFSPGEIIQSNLDRLLISLNAHSKEMYESINRGLDYEKVMKNISNLLSDQAVRQKIAMSFVVTEQNMREVHQATQYWKKQGVKTRVIDAVNRAGSLDNYEGVRPKVTYYGIARPLRVWRRLMSAVRGVVGCERPFYHMSILFNGDVILCCHDWNRATVVGNVRNSSLREIWNSEKMNEIRRLILRKRYAEISSCKECSFVK